MISVSQVKDREERADAWEKARSAFAKDVCHHCAKGVEITQSVWTGPGRQHVVGGDLNTVRCLADNIWALRNPITDGLLLEPGPYFNEEFSHVIRLAVDKVGAGEVSKYLEVSEDRVRAWVWGRGKYPAPSCQDLFANSLRSQFELEDGNGTD